MTIIRLNTGKEHHHPPGETGNIKSSTVIVGGDCLVCILHVCVGGKRWATLYRFRKLPSVSICREWLPGIHFIQLFLLPGHVDDVGHILWLPYKAIIFKGIVFIVKELLIIYQHFLYSPYNVRERGRWFSNGRRNII